MKYNSNEVLVHARGIHGNTITMCFCEVYEIIHICTAVVDESEE